MPRELMIQQPFDLALSLEMGQAFRWRRVGDENRDWGNPPERWRDGDGWYSGVLGDYLVHIRRTRYGVEYRVGDGDGERDDVDLSQRLHHYFRLGDDIDAIHAELVRDPVLARAVERYPGMRLLRQEPWECLVSYLCSGINSVRSIQRSVERIAKLSRRTVNLDGDVRHAFPTAEEVDAQGPEALPSLGLERARNISAIAGKVAGDPPMLERLAEPSVTGPEAVERLGQHRGVGPKIGGCIALMSLDKLDAFPVDRWIQRALADCDLSEMPAGRVPLAEKVKRGERLTPAQQYRVAEWARGHFGRYAGYAGQLLFHWVEPHKEQAGRTGGCPVCGTA